MQFNHSANADQQNAINHLAKESKISDQLSNRVLRDLPYQTPTQLGIQTHSDFDGNLMLMQLFLGKKSDELGIFRRKKYRDKIGRRNRIQGAYRRLLASQEKILERKKIIQEHQAKIKDLTFGYEEALGYAVDAKTVNDKDGISAAITLAQMATDLAVDGKTVLDLLDEIWERHGFHGTEQISIRLSDLSKVNVILGGLRKNPPQSIAGRTVTSIDDLAAPTDGLPPTDGLRIWLDGGVRIIIRPSGTEAKMKCYIEVIEKDSKTAQVVLDQLRPPLKELLS
jgi:hypothetical protein